MRKEFFTTIIEMIIEILAGLTDWVLVFCAMLRGETRD